MQGNVTGVLMSTKQAFHPLSCLPSTRQTLQCFFSFPLSHLFSPFLKNNCAHIKFLLPALSVTFILIHDFFFFILFHLIFSKLFMVPCGCFLLCNPFFFTLLLVGDAFFSVSSINLAQLGSKGLQWPNRRMKTLAEIVSTIVNGWKQSRCGVSGEIWEK